MTTTTTTTTMEHKPGAALKPMTQLLDELRASGLVADLNTEEGRRLCLNYITSSELRYRDFGFDYAVLADVIYEQDRANTTAYLAFVEEHFPGSLFIVHGDEGLAPCLEDAWAQEYSRAELDAIWGTEEGWPYHERLQAMHHRRSTSPARLKELGY